MKQRRTLQRVMINYKSYLTFRWHLPVGAWYQIWLAGFSSRQRVLKCLLSVSGQTPDNQISVAGTVHLRHLETRALSRFFKRQPTLRWTRIALFFLSFFPSRTVMIYVRHVSFTVALSSVGVVLNSKVIWSARLELFAVPGTNRQCENSGLPGFLFSRLTLI